jgi:hypothetical protein
MQENEGNITLERTPNYAEVAKSEKLYYTWGTYILTYKYEKD